MDRDKTVQSDLPIDQNFFSHKIMKRKAVGKTVSCITSELPNVTEKFILITWQNDCCAFPARNQFNNSLTAF